VLRYLGYLLMVLAVLALAGAAAVCLFGGLAEQFRMPGSVRLIAFDDAATTKTRFLRVGAQIEDFVYTAPIVGAYLVARYDDGWCEGNYTNSSGLTRWFRRGPLPAGRHTYTVMFPETHPRVDVRACGTVWVVPAGVRALWVDAAALGPGPQADGPSSGPPRAEAMQPALDALKTLATGRQVVYLVAADAAEYQAVRRRLGEARATPGPVILLRRGNEIERLKTLLDAWPDVDGAVVAAPAAVDAIAKMKIRVLRLPHAGEDADAGTPESGRMGAARSAGERK
jgi:hypothetical protein